MNIKKLEPIDIGNCANDFLESFNSPPWCGNWSQTSANEYVADIYSHPKFIGFVLYEREKNIAYALCYNKCLWGQTEGYETCLELFFVKAVYQNKGYGKFLLKHMENYALAHNSKSIKFITRTDTDAYHFYGKNDYELSSKVVYMGKQLSS